MSEDPRLALLQQGVDAFNRGDADPALAIFAEDVECHVAPDLMNAGTYHGHEGYLTMIRGWGEAWKSVTAEVLSTENLPNHHLLVEVYQQAIGAISGVPVEITLFWLFQFVDGKVTRFHLYADREAAVAAARG
jgi:ketosteroid isomerase-like protein